MRPRPTPTSFASSKAVNAHDGVTLGSFITALKCLPHVTSIETGSFDFPKGWGARLTSARLRIHRAGPAVRPSMCLPGAAALVSLRDLQVVGMFEYDQIRELLPNVPQSVTSLTLAFLRPVDAGAVLHSDLARLPSLTTLTLKNTDLDTLSFLTLHPNILHLVLDGSFVDATTQALLDLVGSDALPPALQDVTISAPFVPRPHTGSRWPWGILASVYKAEAAIRAVEGAGVAMGENLRQRVEEARAEM